jgi:Lon protease-like protein
MQKVRVWHFYSCYQHHNSGFRVPLCDPGKTVRDATQEEMSTFGDDLIQAMTESLAHAKGEGAAIVHAPVVRAANRTSNLSEAAPLSPPAAAETK